ncbi:MAG: hypothetical protein CL533_04315 [Afipia sp.]|nr:hypothetical protein [Afipia sp.]OUX62333.1 MAG: hypothetical protein CBB64_04295 [Afipia sp. TMED4]
MQTVSSLSLTPQRLTARRVNFNADPSIEIAATFKAACKAVHTAQAEMERIADTVPDEWFTNSGFLKLPHAQVSEADRAALFGNCSPSFCSAEDVDARFFKLARKNCKDPALLARLPEIAADLKNKIAAFNAEREPAIEASGLKKASELWAAEKVKFQSARSALYSAVPTSARGAQALLSVVTMAIASEEKGESLIEAKHTSKIVRNVSAFIGGGSR